MVTRSSRTVLSAFSGLGGLDLGLENAGFSHVGCIEWDEAARRSLKANRDATWELLAPGDIALVSQVLRPATLGIQPRELGLLAGAPPCQPFSKAAQWSPHARVGLLDDRSKCLHDFLTLVDLFLPAAVLIENVTGFVKGEVAAIDTITRSLHDINLQHRTNYTLTTQVVDAADFGVPQHRRRAVIVALRDGITFKWPEPTHRTTLVRAWDAIGSLEQNGPLPELQGKWAGLLASIPEGENYLWHTPRGGGRPLFGYRTRYWSFLLKLAKSLPAWTLPAQPGPATGPFHWNNRPLTIPESLALQSFPTQWIVEGTYRDRVRQVGNATPPLLAEVLGRALATQLFGSTFNSPPKLRISRAGSVPVPTQCRPVPARFRALEADHADHPGAGRGPRPRGAAVMTSIDQKP